MSEMFKLFVIVPPGLEDLASAEVELKCPVSQNVIKGGIELEADLAWIERAHTLLKIPTRILMRLESFKVRDFPKLFQKLSKLSWNQWLSHPEPSFEITAKQSRLIHTGRIEEIFKDALKEAMRKQPLKKDWEKKNYSPQTFFVRLVDDVLTLSLDLSGEPLYKRGLQPIKGEAPLRENFAAAMVFEALGGLEQDIQLIDPMCGSGTFLTEALTFHQPLHLRKFAFEEAPFYKGKILKNPESISPLPVSTGIGFDINHELLNKIKTSLPIKFAAEDSLKKKLSSEESVIICNPPYGERIQIEGKRGSFLKEAWEKFMKVDRPLRFGWLLPSDMDDLFATPQEYRLLVKRHLKNGGKAVTFWLWERK